MLPAANIESNQSSSIGGAQRFFAPVLKVYDDIADYVDGFKVFDLVAFLTVYTLLSNSHTAVDMGFAMIVAALTCFSKIRNHCGFWFGVVAVSLPRMIVNFHGYEDHCFYLIYWCAALGLALSGENREFVFRRSGRLLIGICFGLGCVWKLVSSEFTGGGTLVNLDFPYRVTILAWLMTIWTIVIEGAIAAMFLLPANRITDRFRDATLILFMLTTYIVVPVLGFACAFVAIGVAQTQSPRAKLGYLLTSLTLFVWLSMRSQIMALIT